MNYKHTFIFLFALAIPTFGFTQSNEKILTEKYIKATVEKVSDWQFQNLYTEIPLSDGRTEDVPETGWIRGVFYTGVMAAYWITKNNFMEYGAAAFMLTAEQMLVLIRNNEL